MPRADLYKGRLGPQKIKPFLILCLYFTLFLSAYTTRQNVLVLNMSGQNSHIISISTTHCRCYAVENIHLNQLHNRCYKTHACNWSRLILLLTAFYSCELKKQRPWMYTQVFSVTDWLDLYVGRSWVGLWCELVEVTKPQVYIVPP